MLDVVITGGTVVDGTGDAAYTADIGIRDGRIVEIGSVTEAADQVIEADGALVTPGWVDVHTHYDGQVTWDDVLEPSTSNGVTTLVMGNCGVGFAPVRPSDHDALIDLMEGVEDIPGAALSAGIPWGKWETFGEYLDLLDQGRYAVDIAAQIAHGAVRFYVMGERGAANEDATVEDIAAMATIVGEAMAAGAVGFSTSRTIGHKSKSGRPVPGTFAPEEEVLAFARALGASGHGVFEAIVAGTIGALEGLGGERAKLIDEVPLLVDVARASGRPVTFTVAQLFEDPTHWREVLDSVAEANSTGVMLRPQIIPRSVTIMTSLDTYHLFMERPSYRAIADLPLAERVAQMRKPEVRQRILADKPGEGHPFMYFAQSWQWMFPLTEPANYEPAPQDSILARAQARGVSPLEEAYDRLLDDDGHAMMLVALANFENNSLDTVGQLLRRDDVVLGLGDGGAHYGMICDASYPTFVLAHWARDRASGRLSVAEAVQQLTSVPARVAGLDDRGRIALGYKADLNVIDHARLTLHRPVITRDLPAGGRRLDQTADGYVATVVSGEVIAENGVPTSGRPGRLVRGRQAPPSPERGPHGHSSA